MHSPSQSYQFDDLNLQVAVNAWTSNATTAEAAYGHINSWDVSKVKTMNGLFAGLLNLQEPDHAKRAFNDPLDAWDVSRVTDMQRALA